MGIFRIKLKSSYLAAILLMIFPYVVALGAYSQTNDITLAVFWVVAVLFLRARPNKTKKFLKGKYLVGVWIAFIIVNFISTLVFRQFDGMKMILVDIIFTFICFVLCANIKPEEYFNLLRWSMLFFSILGLITFVFHVDFFAFKNVSGFYHSIDSGSGGGISVIFEYRHYFGLYLAVTLFVQIIYPFKNYYCNSLAITLLILNIVATYTRSVWIVLAICGLFWIVRRNNKIISVRKTRRMIYAGLGLAVSCLFLLPMYFDRIAAVFDNIRIRMDVFDISDPYFGGVRLYVLREGFQYIFDHWENNLLLGGGTGYAMQWLRANPFGQWGEWSSSIDVQYVTSFMDSGIIGLGLLLVLVKRIIKTFFKAKEKLNTLVSFSLIYIIFILFFYDIFGMVTSAFPIWCVCVCLLKKNTYELDG